MDNQDLLNTEYMLLMLKLAREPDQSVKAMIRDQMEEITKQLNQMESE